MKTYQAEVSYRYFDRTDTWRSEQKYPTFEEAQKMVDVAVSNISRQYQVYYGKVIEGEQEDTLVMEGTVSDNGCEYEDYALTIEQEEGTYQLIESVIGNNYKGRRVRITVELLD